MKPQLDTVVIAAKGICYFGAGWCAGFAGATAQYLNTGESPSKMAWGVIFAASFGGGFTNLLAFMSNSFGGYIAKQGGTSSVLTIPVQAPTVKAP